MLTFQNSCDASRFGVLARSLFQIFDSHWFPHSKGFQGLIQRVHYKHLFYSLFGYNVSLSVTIIRVCKFNNILYFLSKSQLDAIFTGPPHPVFLIVRYLSDILHCKYQKNSIIFLVCELWTSLSVTKNTAWWQDITPCGLIFNIREIDVPRQWHYFEYKNDVIFQWDSSPWVIWHIDRRAISFPLCEINPLWVILSISRIRIV